MDVIIPAGSFESGASVQITQTRGVAKAALTREDGTTKPLEVTGVLFETATRWSVRLVGGTAQTDAD